MTMSIRISGIKQLERRLGEIQKAPREMLKEMGGRGVSEAAHLVHVKTGNLRRTIRVSHLTDSYVEITAGGTNAVGYAAVVELGSRPHVIVPRQAKVLAWGGPRTLGGRVRKGGKPVHFARKVDHPGTRPYPYLRPGVQKALDILGISKVIDYWNRGA